MLTRSFHILSFRRIELRLDFSWFITFAVIAWSYVAVIIPAQLPNQGVVSATIIGITATFLFFASLVVHEYSHSLYAISHGLRVRRIVLFIFGGVSQLESEPTRPGQEFMMAILGPAASVALGLLFGLVWLAGFKIGSSWLSAIGEQLAIINIFLAAFNLIPAFPLDGGRVFHAIVWAITRNLRRATRIASGAGQLLGLVVIGVGAWEANSGGIVGGVWLAFIGIFLIRAARASYRDAGRLPTTNVTSTQL